jgi:hypothetical protein
MNNYCYKFDHNFVLPTKEQIYPNGVTELQAAMPKDLLDTNIYNILKMVDINVRWIEVHYKIALPAGMTNSAYGTVHADGDEFDNKAKINFVIGGTDSAMIWHEFANADRSAIEVDKTKLVTSVIRPKSLRDKVREVHRESFRAAIVNVGQLHSIENTKDERICIQLIIEDMVTKKRLDFPEAIRRFQMIESVVNPTN